MWQKIQVRCRDCKHLHLSSTGCMLYKEEKIKNIAFECWGQDYRYFENDFYGKFNNPWPEVFSLNSNGTN